MINREYPSKLLLFGEYTVLVGSRALAIPISRWSGKWIFKKNVDASLNELVTYLQKSQYNGTVDLIAFQGDILKGLHFDSTIPRGYGLGSSAALTAAIFDNYCATKNDRTLTVMIEELAAIESYYHGHSSGLDPLVSLLRKPVLHEGHAHRAVNLSSGNDMPQIFLVNSGIGRFTAPLVALFKSRLGEPDFVNEVVNPLKVNVDHAIDNFLSGSWDTFWDFLQLISEMQYAGFKEMLPEPVEHIWKSVMPRRDICLKLCGAGGGGYFLGFARPGIDVEQELGCAVEIVEVSAEHLS